MTTPSTPSPERPTTQDLARDLADDLREFTERDGRDWALWLCDHAEEMLPAAIRRALYAEHLLDKLALGLIRGAVSGATIDEAEGYLDALDSARQR